MKELIDTPRLEIEAKQFLAAIQYRINYLKAFKDEDEYYEMDRLKQLHDNIEMWLST